MNIQKWNPWNWLRREEDDQPRQLVTSDRGGGAFSPLMRLHGEIDRMFDSFFRDFGMQLPDAASGGTPALLKPSVDIAENDRHYTITVEVPGVSEDDVQLSLTGRTLTISGEKRQEKTDEDRNWHRVERSYGAFRRVLSLPTDADQDDIQARFRNGVLTITIPRKAEARAQDERVIEIARG